MKAFIFFCLLILPLYKANAQKIQLKPSAGLNFTITETHREEKGSAGENWFIHGPDMGCYAEKSLNKKISFETGCFYSLNHGYIERPYPFLGSPIPEDPVATEKYNLYYFKFPVNLLFKLNKNGKHQIWGFGPVIKYSFAAGRKITVPKKT
jgi:hypothetical protein